MHTPTHRADFTPDWARMLDAHAAKGIAAPCRCPEHVAERQATYEEANHG